jgi:hypothetical protein
VLAAIPVFGIMKNNRQLAAQLGQPLAKLFRHGV